MKGIIRLDFCTILELRFCSKIFITPGLFNLMFVLSFFPNAYFTLKLAVLSDNNEFILFITLTNNVIIFPSHLTD